MINKQHTVIFVESEELIHLKKQDEILTFNIEGLREYLDNYSKSIGRIDILFPDNMLFFVSFELPVKRSSDARAAAENQLYTYIHTNKIQSFLKAIHIGKNSDKKYEAKVYYTETDFPRLINLLSDFSLKGKISRISPISDLFVYKAPHCYRYKYSYITIVKSDKILTFNYGDDNYKNYLDGGSPVEISEQDVFNSFSKKSKINLFERKHLTLVDVLFYPFLIAIVLAGIFYNYTLNQEERHLNDLLASKTKVIKKLEKDIKPLKELEDKKKTLQIKNSNIDGFKMKTPPIDQLVKDLSQIGKNVKIWVRTLNYENGKVTVYTVSSSYLTLIQGIKKLNYVSSASLKSNVSRTREGNEAFTLEITFK